MCVGDRGFQLHPAHRQATCAQIHARLPWRWICSVDCGQAAYELGQECGEDISTDAENVGEVAIIEANAGAKEDIATEVEVP